MTVVLKLQNHAQVLRQSPQIPHIAGDNLGCAVVVFEHRVNAVADTVVADSEASINGVDKVDDEVDKNV